MWWEGTKYPTCEWVSDTGDPVRTFERALDRNADRAWSCYMLVEDTLTAHGATAASRSSAPSPTVTA